MCYAIPSEGECCKYVLADCVACTDCRCVGAGTNSLHMYSMD